MEAPTVKVFATPRLRGSVNVFDEAGMVLVDLRAELPSYCLRPHVQQAAFLATTAGATYDLTAFETAEPAPRFELNAPDGAKIATIKIDFAELPNWVSEDAARHMYPPASKQCQLCAGRPLDDLNGDLLLHTLSELRHACTLRPTSAAYCLRCSRTTIGPNDRGATSSNKWCDAMPLRPLTRPTRTASTTGC